MKVHQVPMFPESPESNTLKLRLGQQLFQFSKLVLMHAEETCSMPGGSLENDSVITSANVLPYIPGELILEQFGASVKNTFIDVAEDRPILRRQRAVLT